MEYTPLLKLYYKDPALYEEISAERTHHPDAVHLNFNIHDSQAFFIQNSETYRLLLQIHKTDKKIESLCHRLPGIALNHFASRCLVDEIVLSNDIEGVNSTRREISEVLEQLSISRHKRRFAGLVQRYLMLQKNDERKLDTCQDIRDIYDELVLKEVIEEDAQDAPDGKYFRKGPVSVSNATQKEIHRGLFPESKIITTMESALSFLNDENIDSLIRISIFHYLVGYIHPFYNGNGRLSRFISSYMLSKELNYLIGYRLSYTIKDNLKKYYDSFKLCNDPKNNGDLTPFLIIFLEILQTSMEQLELALSRRSTEYQRFQEFLTLHPLSANTRYQDIFSFLLQAGLFSGHGVSTRELQELLSLTYTPLYNRLEEIRKRNLLLEEKIGKEKFYKLNLSEFERQCLEENNQ